MMEILVNPDKQETAKRLTRTCTADESLRESVAHILEEVRTKGDAALYHFNRTFDGVQPDTLAVTAAEFAAAEKSVPDSLKRAIDTAYSNIEKFHRAQLPAVVDMETMPGVRCVQKALPIHTVGLYVPGGSAPLFSTVLMLAIPARVAGCKEIILCTPPQKNGTVAPAILYAAKICRVEKVFKTGGAQAVAAMGYGTETIPKTDKIFGPGNRYVTVAKQLISAQVAIDMPAGPSEVMVLADDTAHPAFVAADLLSQAEHGSDSQSVLLTTSRRLAEQTLQEIARLSNGLPRKAFIEKSLDNGCILVFDTRETLAQVADAYAPEHLIVAMENPWEMAEKITAGSIFIGNFSPESAGDYASGTNHTLPTAGLARAFGSLGVDSFMRKTTCQEITGEGLAQLASTVVEMAQSEGLEAHALAVTLRLNSLPAAATAKQCAENIFVQPYLQTFAPYATARDEYSGEVGVYLDANENPYGTEYNRYPDPHQKKLKQAIAEQKEVDVRNVFIGNGSDEAIDLLYRACCCPQTDNVVAIAPTYGMYKVAAAVNRVAYREVALTDDFGLDVEKILAAADGHSKILFLCSPNNPTGNRFPRRQIDTLIARFPGLVVIDEAYIDFSSDKGFLTAVRCSTANVVVLQTLSKAWGMAGLRVGLAFAQPGIIDALSRIKYPYNVNGLTQQIALQTLQNPPIRQCREIIAQREILAAELVQLPCVRKVYPSEANFLLVKVRDARACYRHLLAQGIIVRDRSQVPGCEDCLRITVGTPAENQQLLQALKTCQ